MDVQEYAKEKGIPVGSIPVHAFRKAQQTPITIRQAENSKAEAFKKLCTDTIALVDQCKTSNGSGDAFPEACADLGMKHMECMLNKREQAMQLAIKLAGKDKCEKVFPYYEDSKNKAMELINVYKGNVDGGKAKKDVFWG